MQLDDQSDEPYWLKVLLAVDQFFNVLLFDGNPDETISSRAGRVLQRRAEGIKLPGDWKWCILCKFLDLFQKDHCIKSIGA